MALREVAAQVLILGGSAIFLFEFVRLARLYLRAYRVWRAGQGDRAAVAAARLEVAYAASKQAIFAGVGLTLTFLGLVLTAVVSPWILLAPALICLSVVGNVLLFGWLRRRLRRAAARQLR